METSTARKKGLTLAIVFAVIFVLAVAGGVFFLVDGMRVDSAIAQIDSIHYDDLKTEKAAQYSFAGKPITTQITESLEDSVYHTPLGFSIVSHTSKWSGQKLVEIYEQLLKNAHGDEIEYLSQVVLYAGEADYSAAFDAVGDRQQADIDTDVFVDVKALIPQGMSYDAAPIVSDITIYDMDKYDNATDVAETLAHEYGHHFTMFYFMQSDEAVKASEYFSLRGFTDYEHEIFYNTLPTYYENHMWDVYEIAAEDYVQLLGSPDAKRTQTYMDRMDLLEAGMDTYSLDVEEEYVNVYPQENIFIPLADEVAGLRDYYDSLIGLENEYETPLTPLDFGLQIERKSSQGHRYYNITWTMVNTDPGALYTLVCYDTDGELYYPVRTVYGNEEPIARVGTPAIKKGNWIYWWPDGVTDEDRVFKLYLLLPDGRMLASEPFNVEF